MDVYGCIMIFYWLFQCTSNRLLFSFICYAKWKHSAYSIWWFNVKTDRSLFFMGKSEMETSQEQILEYESIYPVAHLMVMGSSHSNCDHDRKAMAEQWLKIEARWQELASLSGLYLCNVLSSFCWKVLTQECYINPNRIQHYALRLPVQCVEKFFFLRASDYVYSWVKWRRTVVRLCGQNFLAETDLFSVDIRIHWDR